MVYPAQTDDRLLYGSRFMFIQQKYKLEMCHTLLSSRKETGTTELYYGNDVWRSKIHLRRYNRPN